jgi:hypothetical protein
MKSFVVITALCVLVVAPATAADFYSIASVSSSSAADDLYPVSNLIQGPGVGFGAAEPHDKTLGGAQGNWVTAAPGGFPSDYIAVAGTPVITLDLGADQLLGEISVWGYSSTNANGVSQFSLAFATEAEGSGNYSSSAGPFFPTNDDTARQSFAFDLVTARYVEFTAEDNFFIAPGDGSGGETPGGDRAGLGEIAFQVVPEPSSALLIGLGILPVIWRRRR